MLLHPHAPLAQALGLLGEGGVVGAELIGCGGVVAELLPLPVGAHDRTELGIALVEPLGEPGVGVDLGFGEMVLELGVLGDQRLDCLEHHPSSVAQQHDPDMTRAPARTAEPALGWSYFEPEAAVLPAFA